MLSQGPEHLLTLEVLCDNYPPSARLFLSFAGGQTRRGQSPEIAKAISRRASQGIITVCEIGPGQVNLSLVLGMWEVGASEQPPHSLIQCPDRTTSFKGIFSSQGAFGLRGPGVSEDFPTWHMLHDSHDGPQGLGSPGVHVEYIAARPGAVLLKQPRLQTLETGLGLGPGLSQKTGSSFRVFTPELYDLRQVTYLH